jgi:hypothetical protein
VRDLTICLPYYLNAGMLQAHYGFLAALEPDLKPHLRLIVVDDGSPASPATPPERSIGLPVEIYRITVDVPWNQDAARNLAVDRAVTDWLVLTDVDHRPTSETVRNLVEGKLKEAVAYRFGLRLDMPSLKPKLDRQGHHHPHPNSWVMTKGLYDQVGGYDEALAGNYGTDGDFARRLAEVARVRDLPWPLVRYPREVIADASTTTLVRKRPEEKERIRAIKSTRGPDWRPLRGSFPWVRVA